MAQKRWNVVIDWIDGMVTDSDQVAVYAETADAAISKARAKWRVTVGINWPNCKIQKAWILTKARERFFC